MTMPAGFAIEDSKLVGYLLDITHVDGASKARFFLAHGFTVADPHALADALIQHGSTHWPGTEKITPFAHKHAVTGLLHTPRGLAVTVLSVWQVKADGLAWLITARPGK